MCIEGDIFLGYEVETHGITTRYESAIGFGECEIVEDDAEILKGLQLICEHCGFESVMGSITHFWEVSTDCIDLRGIL